MSAYSIIIRNGLIFDGAGRPPRQGDIGISEDKIKKIGDLSGDDAPTIIDASNKYVAPGFIDLTTHSDTHWTLFSHPSQESFIRQGVTTIIGGHGGSSLAPLVKGEDIETIQKWVDISTININWQSMDEFLDELERHAIGVNFGTLVGYGTIRRGIIGDESRQADKKEIDQISFLVEKSLREGAFGFSANLGAAHQKSASDEEVSTLLKICNAFKTFVNHHLEDEGKEILPALARVIALSRSSGIRSHIAHFKAIGKGSWKFFDHGFSMIDEAAKEGVSITCDLFPYTRTGSNLYLLLPEWAREGGKNNILEIIKGEKRIKLIEALKELTLHYDKISIASTRSDLDGAGKTIGDLSRISGRPAEEVLLDLLDINKLQISIFSEAISESNIEIAAGKNYSAISSDGVGYASDYRSKTDFPHPRSFGTFPRIFAKLVKEKSVLTWQEAIYKMTGLPAQILGIKDRGIIEKNTFADIVVFDPEKIADHADYINPYASPTGINFVIINGGVALSENNLQTANLGRVLRHLS